MVPIFSKHLLEKGQDTENENRLAVGLSHHEIACTEGAALRDVIERETRLARVHRNPSSVSVCTSGLGRERTFLHLIFAPRNTLILLRPADAKFLTFAHCKLLKCAIAHMRRYAYIKHMQEVVAILSALAEPTRLAALAILWDGSEHCVCELMAKLGASQSRMSRHMGVLKAAGLVTDRRDAQWVRYRNAINCLRRVVAIIDAAVAAFPDKRKKPHEHERLIRASVPAREPTRYG